MRRLLYTMSLMLLCGAAVAAPMVQQFSPQGVVKQVRQVTARFSTQMVAFGDLRAADPFSVDCAVPGHGRWVDGSIWSYDFDRALPGAVACRFTLKEDAHDLAGAPLAGERTFSLSTGGPQVVQSLPREGAGNIDEQQVFMLMLDAVPRADTVAANAWCSADGVNEKIGVRVITGEERERYLALRRDLLDRYLEVYFRAHGVVWRAKATMRNHAKDKLPVQVLQCRRTLPADRDVTLVWGAGIAADNGMATAREHKLAFHTRPDFSAKASCDRLHAKGGCIPFMPIRLTFSAPVAAHDAAAAYVQAPGGKRFKAQFERFEKNEEFVNMVRFEGPFPERASLKLHLPPGLKDDAGRTLVNAARFPMEMRTDEQPPLVKFAAPFGIIEAKGDRMLPVTVRNVEPSLAGRMQTAGSSLRLGAGQDQQVIDWLKKMSGEGGGWTFDFPREKELKTPLLQDDAGAQRFRLPKPNGKRALEVVGIPLKRPGFYVVELASPRLGAALDKPGTTAYVRSAALVTNMTAHFEHGAQSSLVWVTSLDKGQPVGGAEVVVRNCRGQQVWSGASDAEGIAHIAAELPPSVCKWTDEYYISARKGDDFTFTLSDWNRGIEPWRFNLPTGSPFDDTRIAATVFDRTLLRAGETVHMKHFLRRHTGAGFAFVTDDIQQPGTAYLVHQGSGEKIEQALRWDAAGNAYGEWQIPADAKLGVYEVMIGDRSSGRFRVEQFGVPTMRAAVSGPKEPQVAPGAVTLDAQVSYLSGGPAGGAPVTLRTMQVERSVNFSGYEDFAFAAGDVKEGTVKPGATFDDEEGEWNEDGEKAGSETPRARQLVLDRAGGARVLVDQLAHSDEPKALLAELSYQDANGETQTVSARVPLWPSRYVAGIRTDGWVQARDKLKFQVAVLDVAGKPVSGAKATVDVFKRSYFSHRRRLVGGFYAYENVTKIERVGEACAGLTDSRGLLLCDVKAPASGNLILRARAEDADGRASVTNASVWTGTREDNWFEVTDNDRIDLLPEKKRYEPGEQMRFQVRSPFREATALVTVQREGILDTYVRRISARDPVITLPVKGNYAPNVFVSALLVRGRVAGVAPTALVDLGKPAYKLGIAPVKVGWGEHELKVRVETDKPVYKVRERASVRIKVARPDGSAPPAGAAVAIAAVDAGLLELMPNESWNLLSIMMNPRSLQVQTATAQMQVVGKRHFGRKAVPHGGGGGRGQARELFETLLLWQGKVTLDANGEASVQVPLNDSLTSFRIVAIASAGSGMFGTGQVDIRSTQDLMLMAGLPKLVREGDRLHAGFTLRNTTDAALQVQFGAQFSADKGRAQVLPEQAITLAPGQAQEAGWDISVPQASSLQWDVTAVAGDARDRVRITQKVEAAVPTRTLQATLLQLDGKQSMTVERPADALPGHGGIEASFSPKLGGELPGVREYMQAYPYICLEQRVSQAVALRDPERWDAVMATLPTLLDGDGMAKYFSTMDQGSDSLTAYLLSVSKEAGYAVPPEARARMEAALLGFVQGRITRGSGLATGELSVRKLAALEALSRTRPVRPELVESFEIAPDLWPTSAVIDWYLVLQRSPAIRDRAQRLAQAETILRARLNLQGTTMGFSTERSDDWWWLMASPDVNANRLLLALLDNPSWKTDMGRLARGALGRQQHGHWRTTVANAWGVLALERFSDKFESVPVTGKSSAALGGQQRSVQVPGATLLPWPARAAELTLSHEGTGKPWVTVQSRAAIPLNAPLSSGYRITRTVTPVEQQSAGVWKRGDIYRVHLDVEAQSDMSWVVVSDPIPASASILGTGLARDAQIAVSGERQRGWVQPDFIERKADVFRAYYEFVPKGKWSVEYTVRLNNEGRFSLPPTRVEAMYSPEMFGELPNAAVAVGR
ncbi:MG2 domain-containing protein [Massilia terrae]|uniref:MG2 domain-containing protein n=1 Tax=Massilia terrae TaxID=1811224 RepID=A0ABT2CZI3_9BURK|nr:MG2 domain-containing protein [Massilia terrae]MCS0659385.1 MG2 domain-containing protein [Massilia terrae]